MDHSYMLRPLFPWYSPRTTVNLYQANHRRSNTKLLADAREVRTTFSYKWEVDKCAYLRSQEGSSFRSPTFCSPTNTKLKWSFILYPKGKATRNPGPPSLVSDPSSIHLIFEPDAPISTVAKATFYFLFDMNRKQFIADLLSRKYNKGDSSSCHSFVHFEELVLHENDMLTPVCERDMACTTYTVICSITIIVWPSSNLLMKPVTRIQDDFENLLSTGNFTDVVLVAESQEFAAHKVILAARSPVFAAMFTHDLVENRSNRVVIEDLSCLALERLLEFIYTDDVTLLMDYAEELWLAAEKYNVKMLKSKCEQFLSHEFTPENVSRLVVLADRTNSKELRINGIRFICLNKREVLQSTGWELLMNIFPTLALEILMFAVMV